MSEDRRNKEQESELDTEELEQADGEPLPDREVMSRIGAPLPEPTLDLPLDSPQ
jgi:hypothetical protein